MALALAGTPNRVNSGGASSIGVFVPATGASNCVVFVAVLTNGGPVTSVTDNGAGALTAWTKVGADGLSTTNVIELWWAIAASAVAASTVTVTVNTTSSSFITVDCWAVSGAETTVSPFNARAVFNLGAGNAASISTSIANTFIFGAYRFNSTATPTAGTGFTTIQSSGSNYLLTEYKIVSATQAGLSVAIGTGAGDSNGGIVAAIKIAGSGAGGGVGPVIFDAKSTAQGSSVTSVTFTHTPTAVEPTGIIIGAGGFSNSTPFSNVPLHAGTPVPLYKNALNGSDAVVIFGLPLPALGPQTIFWDCTAAGATYPIVYATTVTGSDGTTVFSAGNTATGTGTALSVTVSGGASSERLFCVGEVDTASADMSSGGGGANTTNHYLNTVNGGERASWSEAPGGSSVTSTYTASASTPWLMAAASVKAASAAAGPALAAVQLRGPPMGRMARYHNLLNSAAPITVAPPPAAGGTLPFMGVG